MPKHATNRSTKQSWWKRARGTLWKVGVAGAGLAATYYGGKVAGSLVTAGLSQVNPDWFDAPFYNEVLGQENIEPEETIIIVDDTADQQPILYRDRESGRHYIGWEDKRQWST